MDAAESATSAVKARRAKLASRSLQDWIFDIVVYLLIGIITVVTLYPFLNVLAISFNDSVDTVRGGISIYPREFTLENYKLIFSYGGLITGFKISVLRTLAGTLAGLISGSMVAYTLARTDFQGRRFISTFLAITDVCIRRVDSRLYFDKEPGFDRHVRSIYFARARKRLQYLRHPFVYRRNSLCASRIGQA